MRGLSISLKNAWSIGGWALGKWRGPHWTLGETDCQQLGNATANVLRHWPGVVRESGGPMQDIASFVMVAGTVFVPRINYDRKIAELNAQAAEREAAEARARAMQGQATTSDDLNRAA